MVFLDLLFTFKDTVFGVSSLHTFILNLWVNSLTTRDIKVLVLSIYDVLSIVVNIDAVIQNAKYKYLKHNLNLVVRLVLVNKNGQRYCLHES